MGQQSAGAHETSTKTQADGTEPAVEIDDLQAHHFEQKPWTKLDVLDGPERFQFLVVTDRTGGMRPGIFADAAEKIDLLQPAFVVSVGDLIQGYTDDKDLLTTQWNEFDAIVEDIEAPFFYTPGNHDLLPRFPATGEVWKERHGRSYYHFKYKDTLFLILNAEFFDRTGAPWFREPFVQRAAKQQAEQLAYVEQVLEENSDVRWTFVMVHKPYWRKRWVRPAEGEKASSEGPWPQHDYVPAEWQRVEAMLDDRNYTIFAGHMHSYHYDGSEDGPHSHDKIALATTGGGSSLRGVDYGEFDHMVWVTMTDDGPVIANLLQDGILSKNPKISKRRPWFAK